MRYLVGRVIFSGFIRLERRALRKCLKLTEITLDQELATNKEYNTEIG